MNYTSQLFYILVVVGSALLDGVLADPPYTYREGEWDQSGAVFANCTVNIKGQTSTTLRMPAPFIMDTPGAFITFIRVDNLKPKGQEASIIKTGGGVNKAAVTFDMVSQNGHGFWFQFLILGRTPLGTSEPPLVGSCVEE